MADRWSCRTICISVLIFSICDCTVQLDQITVSPQERSALLRLRSSFGIGDNEWPRRSDPCSSWVGIRCTNGRVTGIRISGFIHARPKYKFAVDALENLTLLSSFTATNFPLPRPILECFGIRSRLPSLLHLTLRNCFTGGTIPLSFGNVSSLLLLDLSGNNLTGVIPQSLFQLSGLFSLDLSHNSLKGPIPIPTAPMNNLISLDLSCNFLSGEIPPGIGRLSGLLFLELSSNNLSSSIPHELGNLSRLLTLDLGSNLLSGEISPRLGALTNLRILYLENNFLTGQLDSEMFSNMSQLQLIHLNNNSFLGYLPGALLSIPSLVTLDVSANNFTGRLPMIASGGERTAGILKIAYNSLYGEISPVVTRFEFSDLTGNYLCGPVPAYAGGGETTYQLYLDQNCLQGAASQRDEAECASFYAAKGLYCGGLTDKGEGKKSISDRIFQYDNIVLLLFLVWLARLVQMMCNDAAALDIKSDSK